MTEISIVVLFLLVSALALCIGMLIGMFVDEKINKTYYLNIVETIEKFLKEHNKIHTDWRIDMQKSNDDWYTKSANLHKEYLDTITNNILENQKLLAGWIDEINKSCYVPIWKNVDEELPECEGVYYGKKDETNSMWKVIYKNSEWFLSGYPTQKIEVIKWTELY